MKSLDRLQAYVSGRLRARYAACAIGLVLTSAACDIIVPPDPPPELTHLRPDDFVWKDIEISRDYEFIGVPRIDCPKIVSKFTGHGKCRPAKLPLGSVTECDLAHPGVKLQMACIDIDDIPAVYVRIEYATDAGEIDFSRPFGACTYALDGPAARREKRFDTDKGHKVCLFGDFAPYSKLRGQETAQMPGGLFIDFSNSDFLPDSRAHVNKHPVFTNPDALVLDARLLSPDERKLAFEHLSEVFEFYSGRRENDHINNDTDIKE